MAGAAFDRNIAEMKAWDFWAHPRSLPLTEDEVEACLNGTATDEQINRMLQLGQFAANQLITMVPNEARPC